MAGLRRGGSSRGGCVEEAAPRQAGGALGALREMTGVEVAVEDQEHGRCGSVRSAFRLYALAFPHAL